MTIKQFAADPLTGALDLAEAVSVLVTKALPSDAERLERLKQRTPKIYARIRQSIIDKCVRYCKKRKLDRETATNYVRIQVYNLPEVEQWMFVDVVLEQLHFPNKTIS
jgi:hypothetical protein